MHLRANCLTALKDDQSALTDLKKLLKLFPVEPRAYLKAIKCYNALGQFDNALKVVELGQANVDKSDPKYKV